MKKLALLLGALSLVSSVAYAKEVVPAVEEVVVVEEVKAAPVLRVTSFGQSIEIDNYSRHKSEVSKKYGLDADNANVGDVMLGHSVGLAYGDNWTFDLFARKQWMTDTDDGMHSDGHRIQIDAWRAFDNYSLGFRWRGDSAEDKYLLRGKYSYGMFSGWVDAGYVSKNGGNDGEGATDKWYSEGMPIAVTYGPVTAGYYYEFDKTTSASDDDFEGSLKHQVRLMAPLYTGEKLSVGAEYRYQFAHDQDYAEKTAWVENNRHIAILSASYALTENLTIDGYYEYDFNKYDLHDAFEGDKEPKDDYYGEFYIGWTYSF